MVDANFIRVFRAFRGKVVIKETLPTGLMQQVALVTISKSRITLDGALAPWTPTALAAIYAIVFTMFMLHRSLGHTGQPAIKILFVENMVHGIEVVKGTDIEPCDACL